MKLASFVLNGVAAAACLTAAAAAHAGATTDGSMGAVQSLSGHFTVPQSLGTLRGANLFHSFARFSIGAAESATFTTLDAGVRNVVSRVTGGEASLLQGPLALRAANGARPDFFFVNPSGITLAHGASVDVPGALHLSTAAQLRFADGSSWATNGAAPSTLSVAAPEAFGFLGTASAPIGVTGTTLAAGTGRGLTLGAGAITLSGSLLLSDNSAGAAGAIALRANGDLRVADSRILATGSGGAGDIELRAGRALVLGGSEVFAAGGGGDIRLAGQTIALDASTVLASTPNAGIAPGAIAVAAEGAVTLDNAAEISTVTFAAHARPQAITLDAASLRLSGASLIATTALAGGDAGGLRITVPGEVRLESGARILSSTGGAGRAGAVVLRAGSLRVIGVDNLVGDDIDDFYAGSGIFSQSDTTASGASGSIDLQVAGAVELTRQSLISVASAWSGAAGSLSIQAASVLLDGEGLPGFKGLASTALAQATDAGRIDLRLSGDLVIRGGAGISSETASTVGRGGDVTVRAATVTLDGSRPAPGRARTGIFAGALPGSSGRVGVVDVAAAGRLSVLNGAAIGIANESRAEPASAAAAEPALLRVHGGQVLIDRGELTASSVGRIAAGAVRLGAGGALTLNRSVVRTSAENGNGGPITVEAGGVLRLSDARITTSVSGTGPAASGDGGDIRITAPAFVLASSAVQANTTVAQARGGTVVVQTAALVPDGSHVFVGGNRILALPAGTPGANVIQAAAPDGVGGTLALAVPQLDLSGALTGLAAAWIDFGALALDVCLRNDRSSFGLAGRGALPPLAAQVLRYSPAGTER